LTPPFSKSSEALNEFSSARNREVLVQPINGNQGSRLVVELVRQAATTAPKAPALISVDETVTYGDLEKKANQLANYLRSIGVGPELPVGLCLNRGPSMVISALAVLKAGGAYLPLDPDYPVERLRFMLEDARVPALITRQEIGQRIGNLGWNPVHIDSDASQISAYPANDPPVATTADNLAYVIYTSGSSGQPKGVQITHGNLSNLIAWHRRAFQVSGNDRASQVASVGFDAAVWEIWPNLAAGSSIHFAPEEVRVAAEPLKEWLIAERITISFVPTPLAEGLITLAWPGSTALRLLLTGGDALHHYPHANLPFRFVNNYGPTECTVVATSGEILSGLDSTAPPAIGRPIDNSQIHIVDEHLQRVPDGAVGELYIAGHGVARGYLNRPELNAERFISNSFSGDGGRMYKTGDLARMLPTGEIAFVGRIDDQIKIRGYRIEPEEIVMRLDQCFGVEASVVVARGENGDNRLIAYVVPSAGAKLTHNSLQQYLTRYLPDYMIPSAFVRMTELPLNANGKVSRSALPVPSPENTITDSVRVGPSTPIEERVIAIVSELLGLDQVGVNDNFFFLGGHSLLGTQLIARARDSFGIELPLRTVFDSPTASQLSAEIERLLKRGRVNAN
jgi:amino acid adenylation domain-containing protein